MSAKFPNGTKVITSDGNVGVVDGFDPYTPCLRVVGDNGQSWYVRAKDLTKVEEDKPSILRGVWSVDAGAGSISCSDFETDVMLTISGDFGGWDKRYAYAQALCDRLNKVDSNE